MATPTLKVGRRYTGAVRGGMKVAMPGPHGGNSSGMKDGVEGNAEAPLAANLPTAGG